MMVKSGTLLYSKRLISSVTRVCNGLSNCDNDIFSCSIGRREEKLKSCQFHGRIPTRLRTEFLVRILGRNGCVGLLVHFPVDSNEIRKMTTTVYIILREQLSSPFSLLFLFLPPLECFSRQLLDNYYFYPVL